MKVLKFGADWCSQCKAMDNELKEHPLIIETDFIDVDDANDSILEKYQIRSIPIIIVLDDSNIEIKRWIGRTSPNEINQFLEKYERKES